MKSKDVLLPISIDSQVEERSLDSNEKWSLVNSFFQSASTGIFIEYDKNKNLTFVNVRMISTIEKRLVVAAVESKPEAKIIVVCDSLLMLTTV